MIAEMASHAVNDIPRYLQIAQMIEAQISRGVLRVGDRVPSVRSLSGQQDVSISTVLQAYFWLENHGFIEARPQSGFYVKVPFADLAPEPSFVGTENVPTQVGIAKILHEIMAASGGAANFPLGAGAAGPELYPTHKLNQIIAQVLRQHPRHSAGYDFPPGAEPLRRQIARHTMKFGCEFSPADIVITCGGMEALNLGLRAVAGPGDIIAIESPTFFGVLQVIESLGMRAIEIPSHPRTGMQLEHLERAIHRHPVKACVVMTNSHNPLGYVLGDEYKKNLVDLLTRHDVPLIEDDVYGDLVYGNKRPAPAKVFDRKGLVLLCSSFSKVMSPGFRIGWIHGGRYRNEVERLKFITTVASSSLQQLVIASFLESGAYDRYVRRLRIRFADQVQTVSRAIAKYFPESTRISRPQGGYLLWVELPRGISAMKLYEHALAQHVFVLPGPMFSPTRGFKNYIRINCSSPWSEQFDRALLTVGRICFQLGKSRVAKAG
jgi:DNA-binding transcriptional MocR family regulator